MFYRKILLPRLLLSAALAIPTQSLDQWTQLKFSKIPANQVSVDGGQLTVSVKSSASPLVYKLPQIHVVSGFDFEMSWAGTLPTESADAFSEDYPFRLGLVATGEKTLSRLQRLVAADWVKKLFDLSPPGVGLDKIYFYNLSQNKNRVGTSRAHPKTELMNEFVFASLSTENRYVLRLDKPIKVAALWLSIDGDDTGSDYSVRIKNLSLDVQ